MRRTFAFMKKPKTLKSGFHGLLGMIIPAAAAILAIAVYMLLVALTSLPPVGTGLVIGAVYIAATAVITFIMRPKIDLEIREGDLHPLLGEIMLSSMVSISVPAIIAGKDDKKIIWYNREASHAFKSGKTLRGAFISDILDIREAPADESDAEAGVNVKYADHYGHIFKVKISDITAGNQTYELYSAEEVTEFEQVKASLANREMMIAYIMVDNIDELLQHEQEEYRLAASKAEAILRNFAAEADGILKEYQADRYIMIFEARKFSEFVAHRFDILDKIREIRVGTGSTPITISIGIANTDGTFAEKEKGAQAALEMALQRGGDQVVVKNRDGSQSIYGGRTKTIQKKGRVRARTVASEMLVHISNAPNVIVMAHKRPDFDAFGASLGVARLCMFCGVPVNIVTDFSFNGIEKCLEWIKDEPDYESVLVDSQRALDLVSPDTLLIIVDVNNQNVFEEPHLIESCDKVIIIDHHRKTAEFPKEPLISYIEPSASATCELVSEMLEQILPDELLLPREADIMFAGILLDTNQFKKNTGTRTFSAALYLKNRGADISAIQEFFKTSLDDYERENKFRADVQIYREITAISASEEEGDSEDNIPASRAADKLLELHGIKASFVLIKIGEAVHVSARSVGTINVQLILEQLKGGGHFDAAGAQIKGSSVGEVVELLKGAIDKYLDESSES